MFNFHVKQLHRYRNAVAPRRLAVAVMIAATFGCATVSSKPLVVAQAGATGGTIGNIDKSVSGVPDSPARAIQRKPRRSLPSATRSPCGKLTGVWSWFSRRMVTFVADGTASSGTLTARWTCESGNVTIHWSHGYVDRLTLSADGNSLTGTNGIIPVWGKRK
jgi:hypothetical protein